MFFLMKKMYFPQWDNDDNKDGGTASLKVHQEMKHHIIGMRYH